MCRAWTCSWVAGTWSSPMAAWSFSRSVVCCSRSRRSGSVRLFLSSSCCNAGAYAELSRVGIAVGVVAAAGVGTAVGTAVGAVSGATAPSGTAAVLGDVRSAAELLGLRIQRLCRGPNFAQQLRGGDVVRTDLRNDLVRPNDVV